MHRRSFLTASAALFGVSGCSGSGESEQQPDPIEESWPMYRFDPSRSGRSDTNEKPSSDPGVLWQNTKDGQAYSPAVANNTVFFPTSIGVLYALNAVTGEREWDFQAESAINASPAVDSDRVYFRGIEEIRALDITSGERLWKREIDVSGSAPPAVPGSAPAIDDGTLYVGGDDGTLYALRADSGDERWGFETGDGIDSSPAIADGRVYVGSDDESVYAVNADTGEKEWDVSAPSSLNNPISVAGNTVFVATFGRLIALDAGTGARLWTFSPEEEAADRRDSVADRESSAGAGSGPPVTTAPAVTDEAVLVGIDGILYARTISDGSPLWEFTFDQRGAYDRPPVIVDDTAYVVSDTEVFGIALQDGTTTGWSVTADARPSSPAVTDGIMYFGTNEGHTYAVAGR